MFSLHRLNIACVGGVTASMVAFQAIDPGSTPGRRKLFYMTSSFKIYYGRRVTGVCSAANDNVEFRYAM